MTSALVKFCSSFTWEGRKWVQEEVGRGVLEGKGAGGSSPFLQPGMRLGLPSPWPQRPRLFEPGDSLGGPGRIQPPTPWSSFWAEFLLWSSLRCAVTQALPSSRKEHPSWVPAVSQHHLSVSQTRQSKPSIRRCSEPRSSSPLPPSLPSTPPTFGSSPFLPAAPVPRRAPSGSLQPCCSPITCGPLPALRAPPQPQQAYAVWGLSPGPTPGC